MFLEERTERFIKDVVIGKLHGFAFYPFGKFFDHFTSRFGEGTTAVILMILCATVLFFIWLPPAFLTLAVSCIPIVLFFIFRVSLFFYRKIRQQSQSYQNTVP